MGLFAQREPQREHRHQHAADDAARERRRLGVEMQITRAHRVAPHGRERAQHCPRIHHRARRAEQRAEQRQPRALAEQESPDLSRRESQREQRADFLGALFDAELKQQRHQHARRHDQEKTEPDEQPAEVLSLRARREGLRAHGLEREAEIRRLEFREETLFQFRIRREAHGGRVAETVGPHFSTGVQRDEGLRRAAPFGPVIVVFFPHFVRERKARVPVARLLRLGDAGEVGHQRAIGPRHFQRHDRANAEAIRGLEESRAGVGLEIRERNFRARADLQILREPLVDDDFVVAQIRGHERRTRGGDHRVGRRALARAQEVDEEGEHGLRVGLDRERGAHGGRIEKNARRAQFDGGRIGEGTEFKLGVGELPLLCQCSIEWFRFRRVGSQLGRAEQQQIGTIRCVDFGLERFKSNERVEWRNLVGL